MTIEEVDLPGIGKRFEINLPTEPVDIIIIIHHTGKREVYIREEENEDSQKLLELSDQMAQLVGSVLEGSYFQPDKETQLEAIIDADALIEWIRVPEDSPLVGETIQSANIRARTGVSVIAIQRDDHTIPAPDPSIPIEADDILIGVGSKEAHEAFQRHVQGNPVK